MCEYKVYVSLWARVIYQTRPCRKPTACQSWTCPWLSPAISSPRCVCTDARSDILILVLLLARRPSFFITQAVDYFTRACVWISRLPPAREPRPGTTWAISKDYLRPPPRLGLRRGESISRPFQKFKPGWVDAGGFKPERWPPRDLTVKWEVVWAFVWAVWCHCTAVYPHVSPP